MMSRIRFFREQALALPSTVELPHFEKTSFRVNKKIFASLDEKTGIACLKLNPSDQMAFSSFNPDWVYKIPNKWGLQGWTNFHVQEIPDDIMKDALNCAYETVKKKK